MEIIEPVSGGNGDGSGVSSGAWRRPVDGAPVGVDGLHLTDTGNAWRLWNEWADELRYLPEWGRWLVWNADGGYWVNDARDVAVRERVLAVNVVQWDAIGRSPDASAKDRSAHIRWVQHSEGATAVKASLELARSLPGIAVEPGDLNRDPMLLNCRNGTVDLATGELRAHDPADLITKSTGVDYEPGAGAPRWVAFLERVLPDAEVREFLRRFAGYTLTGQVIEHLMLFLVGGGANGKTTLVEALGAAMGDYAKPIAKEVLVLQRHRPHPTVIADLYGVRFRIASEIESGDRLAEAQVKNLTGGERITARYMHQDLFDFAPSHKLWLASNHRPSIGGTDHGIWRRLRLLLFDETIGPDEQDPMLLDKLADEALGILAWAVQGCIDWQADGLTEPDAVTESTDQWRREEDWFAAFVDAKNYDLDGRGITTSNELWETYSDWCQGNGEQRLKRTAFGRQLTDRGLESVKHGGARAWKGIRRDEL